MPEAGFTISNFGLSKFSFLNIAPSNKHNLPILVVGKRDANLRPKISTIKATMNPFKPVPAMEQGLLNDSHNGC